MKQSNLILITIYLLSLISCSRDNGTVENDTSFTFEKSYPKIIKHAGPQDELEPEFIYYTIKLNDDIERDLRNYRVLSAFSENSLLTTADEIKSYIKTGQLTFFQDHESKEFKIYSSLRKDTLFFYPIDESILFSKTATMNNIQRAIYQHEKEQDKIDSLLVNP